MVPKEGFEPTRPCGHYALNVARLPFRHFGTTRRHWWAVEDLNLGPLACEASALTAELTAPKATVLPLNQSDPFPAQPPRWEAWQQGSLNQVMLRCGNDRARTCDLALMKRPLYH